MPKGQPTRHSSPAAEPHGARAARQPPDPPSGPRLRAAPGKHAEATGRAALALVDENDHWARVRALTALAINRTEMHDAVGALQLIDEASALAEETGDQFSVANTAVQKARVFGDLDRVEESLPWFDRGVAIFAELGARWELADARAARGIAMRELGRLDEAEDDLRYAIRIAEELRYGQLS